MVSGQSRAADTCGMLFNVQRFQLHDGPGIRTIVFLKGCPLSCHWCDNPESIGPKPELAVLRGRCNACGKCVDVCPEQAITLDANNIRVDRELCTACGQCVPVCYPEALCIYGRERTAGDVFDEVARDKIFYEGSGGGATVSGGEALQQWAFTSALLQMCRERGIHTCIETSGYGGTQELEQVLESTDCVLFDLKHLDREVHRRFTGKTNDLILANAKTVAQSGVQVIWRIPLIPGVNDTLENIRDTALFVNGLMNGTIVELLPYHRLGVSKYQALDRQYRLEGLEPSAPEHLRAVKEAFEGWGVSCRVVT